ncbi:MAG: dihydrodipicolinate synthase family protein [Marinosulfonomonas sp.]
MRDGTDLKGVICASVTPLSSQGTIDADALGQHCADMLNTGCNFTSAFGTTGEGASFSVSEKVAALTAMAQSGVDMSRQVPGVMCCSVEDAAVFYRAIAQLGCRAALIIPPYYYDATGEGVADFYASVIERAASPDLDIVLYNFPHFSGVTFTPDLVRAVAARCGGRIVGIKDSTGDLDSGLSLIKGLPDLSIFTGDDRILSKMVASGGAGLIGGMPNLYVKDCLNLYSGNADRAAEELAKQRIEAVDGNGGLVVLKALLANRLGEAAFARTAAPLRPAPADLMAQIIETLDEARDLVSG